MLSDLETPMQTDKIITPTAKLQILHWHMNSVEVITNTFEKNLDLLYSNKILSKFNLTSAFSKPAMIGNMIEPYF